MISTIFILTYIFMAVFLYFRMRALTSFSHLHCFVIALTSSLPAIIHHVASVWELATRYLVEFSFLLGGTSAAEITAEAAKKLGGENSEES